MNKFQMKSLKWIASIMCQMSSWSLENCARKWIKHNFLYVVIVTLNNSQNYWKQPKISMVNKNKGRHEKLCIKSFWVMSIFTDSRLHANHMDMYLIFGLFLPFRHDLIWPYLQASEERLSVPSWVIFGMNCSSACTLWFISSIVPNIKGA